MPPNPDLNGLQMAVQVQAAQTLKPDRINYVIGLEGLAVLAIWGLAWPAA